MCKLDYDTLIRLSPVNNGISVAVALCVRMRVYMSCILIDAVYLRILIIPDN